ncbi:MAG: M23 family metallopeptidase [Pseudomonadota bacterium]|nr:M23 family metallopeptidase [Pseudomonadota bacterium]
MRLTIPALFLAASPALAREPILNLPIDCTLGEDCFILQYTDADPGPGAADYTCGPMAYDGHKGTDFALYSFDAMEAGVNVLAPAPGVVRGVRDGMPDTGFNDTPADVLEGRDCGNGLVIDHGGGWETQVCHLKEGSVTVQSGQRVGMGTVVGQVGYSGRTQYPHVHISVREDGRVVDPFNTDEITACGQDDGDEDDLWSTSPPYTGGGLISVGVSAEVPEYDAIKTGSAGGNQFPNTAPALVAWGFAYGGHTSDVMEITITRPDGSELVNSRAEIEEKQVLYFRAAGKRLPEGGWPEGAYKVTVRLERGGETLDSMDTEVWVGR